MRLSSMGFTEGMMYGAAMRLAGLGGRREKVLDWDRAREIIAEHPNAPYVEAGLAEDWDETCGHIAVKGEPCRVRHHRPYVVSFWATPVVVVDGEVIECWRYADVNAERSYPEDWSEKEVSFYDEDLW